VWGDLFVRPISEIRLHPLGASLTKSVVGYSNEAQPPINGVDHRDSGNLGNRCYTTRGVSKVTSIRDTGHCNCLRIVPRYEWKPDRLHGYGLEEEKPARRTYVLNDPHDHPF
jgi:hypothetical protein